MKRKNGQKIELHTRQQNRRQEQEDLPMSLARQMLEEKQKVQQLQALQKFLKPGAIVMTSMQP